MVGCSLPLGRGGEDKHLVLMIFFNIGISLQGVRGLKGLNRLPAVFVLAQPLPSPIWGCVTANTRTAAIL